MRHLTNLKRRLAAESGLVMIVAIVVLFALITLTTAAIAVSVDTSTSTTRDTNTKAALAAAEAGLQTASYRLSKLEPKESKQCINGSLVVEEKCESGSEPLGNGATFQYWTSKGLAPGEKCAGEEITTVAITNAAQRCITSVGTVNGVQRRVQESTSLLRPPLFEVEGLVGFKSVVIRNSNFKGGIAGVIGSNALIELSNGVKAKESLLWQGPPRGEEKGGEPGPITWEPSPFTLPTVPIGESAESAMTTAGCGKPTFGTAAGKNCDVLITNGINKTNPAEADTVGNNVEFNASTRSLSLGNNSSLELKEGIYNFCDFQVTKPGATLKIALGAKVQIFIDSALREGSGCQNDVNQKKELQAGKLVFKNGLEIINPNTNATSLQIYVYDGSGGPIEFSPGSSSQIYGAVVAPKSKLIVQAVAEFTGAIMANEIEILNNFTFTWEKEVKTLVKETTSYERKAWEECPPAYSVTNPREGC